MLISAAGDVWRRVLLGQYCSSREVEIEPNVKLECVPKFCFLGDTLGAGVDEAARARVRCSWAKFKELSPNLTAHGASYYMNLKICKACVQSVLTNGTETWAMKAENLHSLEITERYDSERDGCVVCL